MQFQVPQFIETEDKVVGPFSLRQFLYVGASVAVSAFFYFLVQTWLFVIITLILVGGALAGAFITIEGRPFSKIVLSAFNFYWNPQTYTWQSEIKHHKSTEHKTSQETGIPLEDIASGNALHKMWENLQTGSSSKSSDRQFIEKKMNERYAIFRRVTGDRQIARRVDYR